MPLIAVMGLPELEQGLRSNAFSRVEVEVVSAATEDQLRKLIQQGADLVLLDGQRPGVDALALSRNIKRQNKPAPAVVVVIGADPEPARQVVLAECLCDAVLRWPVNPSELHEHVAELLDLPRRRSRRIKVSLHLELRAGGVQIPAEVQNLSRDGMCVVARTELDVGSTVTVTLTDDQGFAAEVSARVAWVQPADDGQNKLGIEFQTLRAEVKSIIANLALFEIDAERAGRLNVSLHGEIDERTAFRTLRERLEGAAEVVFDLRGVGRINSAGVRGWCNFIGSMATIKTSFRRCSVAFTNQLSMVPTVAGAGEVLSVMAPYACEACGREVERLVDVSSIRIEPKGVTAPTLVCSCGEDLELDDLPERYLAFAR